MAPNRKKIGEIFVENGTITEKTLQRALERAKKQQTKLGYVLEDMGVVTGNEIMEALADQFNYQKVSNLVRYKFTADLLNLITVETAFRHMIFPLKIKNGKLLVAIADPTDTKIVSNIAANHHLEVIPLVATRADIIAAINKNYLGKEGVDSKRKTVLVADSDAGSFTELEKLLSSKGYHVKVAKDGIEAFKMALSEPPCVIITAKELPKFGGYRLIEAIRNLPETRCIPVILLYGGDNIEEEATAYKHGFFDFLPKPLNHVSLVTRVKKAVKAYEECAG